MRFGFILACTLSAYLLLGCTLAHGKVLPPVCMRAAARASKDSCCPLEIRPYCTLRLYPMKVFHRVCRRPHSCKEKPATVAAGSGWALVWYFSDAHSIYGVRYGRLSATSD